MGERATATGRLPTDLAERVSQLLAQCKDRCTEEVDEHTRHDVSCLQHFDSLARVCFTYGTLVDALGHLSAPRPASRSILLPLRDVITIMMVHDHNIVSRAEYMDQLGRHFDGHLWPSSVRPGSSLESAFLKSYYDYTRTSPAAFRGAGRRPRPRHPRARRPTSAAPPLGDVGATPGRNPQSTLLDAPLENTAP